MAKKMFLEPEELGSVFKAALADKNAVFVFSTDIVKNAWIEWCVTHPDQSGVTAVPLERFMAWDSFKGTAVRAKEDGKASVPSMLRKFFVSSLIAQNASAPDNELIFTSLINPEFRGSADSFSGWLSKLLPSLKLWHERVQSCPGYVMDDEDKDYEELFSRYSDFLEQHDFFEPSWITPDFSRDGKTYIIFYPELLEDYADYIGIFERCPEITLVSLPEPASEKIPCDKFSDSRKELRRTILQIRELSTDVDWNDIALSVPDLETYRPYLERELTRYCVPFVIRAGFPLVKNTAGQVFSEIQNCFISNFSYDSIRSLILDEYVPWKESFSELRENLIREGNRLRCICGYDEPDGTGRHARHFDSWEAALSATSNTNNRELQFYRELKHDISAICKAASFADVLTAWVIFRDRYLSADDFSDLANDIIGQCVSELHALVELEETYCTKESGLFIQNHFAFFVSELTSKTYAPQTKLGGVQVFPYKVAAGAPFRAHFVIDASQRNLEVQYTRLGFLSAQKRHVLSLDAEDKKYNASRPFVRLYGGRFSYAEDSFSGFAICHNALTVPTRLNPHKQREEEVINPLGNLDEADFILAERAYMLGATDDEKPLRLSQAQRQSFACWQFFNAPDGQSAVSYEPAESVKRQIEHVLAEKRGGDKITITQTDMKNFFPCPRKWIFSQVIRLTEDSLDTDLMQPFDMGNINHKILELFMREYEISHKPLPVLGTGTEQDETTEREILEAVTRHTRTAITQSDEDFVRSPLTQKMLLSQEEKIARHILDFLREFLRQNVTVQDASSRTRTPGYGGCMVCGVELSLSASDDSGQFNYFGKLDLLLSPALQNTDAIGLMLIDYKNSKVPSQKSIFPDDDGNLGDFQMPMYITLLQKDRGVQAISVARFYSIKNPSKPTCAIDMNTDGRHMEDFAPTMERFSEYSSAFAQRIQGWNVCPDSDSVDVYRDCLSCGFKSVCRHNYEVSKRTMPKGDA